MIDYDVWVCDAGVYMSRNQAIRAVDRSNRKYNVGPELAEMRRAEAERGRYMRADLAPSPGTVDDIWTAAAKRVRKLALAQFTMKGR
jgi:hypothetical protein